MSFEIINGEITDEHFARLSRALDCIDQFGAERYALGKFSNRDTSKVAEYQRLSVPLGKATVFYNQVTRNMLVPVGDEVSILDKSIDVQYTEPKAVEKIAAILEEKRPAFDRNARFATSRGKFILWLMELGECGYCDTFMPIPSEQVAADHIVPFASGGLTERENMVCSCKRCNQAKGVMDPLKFFKRIEQQDGDKWRREASEALREYYQERDEKLRLYGPSFRR